MADGNGTCENDRVVFGVLDERACWLAVGLDEATAMTLVALVSEDPADWNELLDNWSRYRSPAVCDFPSSLPFVRGERDAIIHAVGETKSWVVVDFPSRRIVTGLEFSPIGRDAVFAMAVDEAGNQRWPLSVHLPPWWELHEQVAASFIDQPRQSPIEKPIVDRDVLYGDALLGDIATRVLATISGDAWLASDAADNEQSRHPFTIDVHRDWLMTPRRDLNGRMPRQLLHGAIDWSSRVVWAQQLRFGDSGTIEASSCGADYEIAPMGWEEMVIYFDLCRELIEAAWAWCASQKGENSLATNDELSRTQLAKYLHQVKEDWLSSPFEGGSPPSFIIECSRRRVPRGAGVPIVGMVDQPSESHVIDCECPICLTMADGTFGVSFVGLDGHHLDLDEEFAFSMHETREEWEEMMREYETTSAAIDREIEQDASQSEQDPFASAWSGIVSDDPIPGDSSGDLLLAFLLAEIVAFLQSQDAHEAVAEVNESFREFRRCQQDETAAAAAERLKSQLESLAERYPDLVSMSADFQGRLDERLRGPQSSR